jgi:nicotinate dehydrogenase large molybdopterin subunit
MAVCDTMLAESVPPRPPIGDTAPRVLRPKSLGEAVNFLGEAGGRIVGGATALQLEWLRGEPRPTQLIDVTGLAELAGIAGDAKYLSIGAATRLAELEESQIVADQAPLLAETVGRVAAPSVRRLATLGGNIAGRTGCLIPILLALEASVAVANARAVSKVLLRDWLRSAAHRDDIIVSVNVPLIAAACRMTHTKIGLRAAFTPSIIGAAGALLLDGAGRIAAARFAVGGGSTPPQCLDAAAASIANQALDAIDWRALRDQLAAEIDAPADHARSRHYRKIAAANALVAGLGRDKAIDEVCAAPPPLRPRPRRPRPPSIIEVSREVLAERWRVRPDMEDKVGGKLAYLTDHRRPGMLVGRILRAGIPHGRIVSIDPSGAEALPGVAAVVTARDIKGQNGYGIVIQDQPALCAGKVRYDGDVVAAVAAVDEATAGRALALICVDYEPLPVVDDMERALAPDAPAVHAAGNLQREMHFARGEIDAAWSRCAHIVESTYVTPRQMHAYMETEGGYAVPEEDGSLTICVGGQHGARDRLQLSRILDIPENRIRVVTSPIGGAFGGKDELTVQPALALLALKSGRAVRLQLDRAESVLGGRMRNPMRIHMRTGCDETGRLIAQELDLLLDCGAYASLSPSVLETCLEHACGPYDIANVRNRGRLAYTNNGICGAFRGFGANQMTYAVECQVTRLADALDLDPIEFRRLNLRKPRSPGYLGQQIAPTDGLVEMLDAAANSDLWQKARGLTADRRKLVGTGLALLHQGTGLGSVVPDTGAGRLTFLPDGRIEAAFGFADIGQGVVAIIQSTVAAALGCDRDDVLPVLGDTGRTPDSGSTTASRGTFVVWKSAALMGPDFGAKLRRAAAEALGSLPENLVIVPGGLRDVRSNSDELAISFAALAERLAPEERPRAECAFEFPKTDYRAGNARFIFAAGAAVARVAVDRATGEVRVLDLEQHVAAGPILDPACYRGQIEGGAMQGIGFTLTEDMILQAGHYVADNFDGYMVPTVADAPQTSRVFALEELEHDDEYGPRGVGELGIGAVTPAIAAAIADACGVWPTVTPISPEHLLAAVSKRPLP